MSVGPGTVIMGLAFALVGVVIARFRVAIARKDRWKHETMESRIESNLFMGVFAVVFGLGLAALGAAVWLTS